MSTYTYTEAVAKTSLLRKVDVKKAKTSGGERITETHFLTDTVSGLTQSKEIKRYVTENDKTRQLSVKKWNLINGKWVKETSAAPLKKY